MAVTKYHYDSMTHQAFVDKYTNKIYYVPNSIAEEMASEKDYDKRMATLARYLLDPRYRRLIRITDGFAHR